MRMLAAAAHLCQWWLSDQAPVADRTLTGQVARVPRYRQLNGLWVGH